MSKFELHQDNSAQEPIIKIIGVGGAGGNAVTHMLESGLTNVAFIAANTDAQALHNTKADIQIQLGENLTQGLGAGANPEVGREAAEESRERIKQELEGANMVFVAAGMGGGTGTGAAPVVAEIAREMGILTVAVVSRPFPFEGKKRSAAADQGLKVLSQHVDSLITIPNERLLSVLGKGASLKDAFGAANNVLYNAVQGITESIMQPGIINLDFNDVKTVMSKQGLAMMGVGVASGDNRAREATQEAISSPLLDDISLQGAKGILVNITAGMDFSIGEYTEIGQLISEYDSEDTFVIIGTAIDETLEEEIRVTLIATGLGDFHTPSEQRVLRPAVGPGRTAGGPGRVVEERKAPAKRPLSPLSSDYLDVPAFLRNNDK